MNISDDADYTKMFLSFSLKDQNLLSRQNLLLKKSPGKKNPKPPALIKI